MKRTTTLPLDSGERKNIPVLSGPIRYFPAALAGIAQVCKAGNDKHNKGQEMHHARGKSADHGDCIVRHLMDVQDHLATIDRLVEPERSHPERLKVSEDLINEVNQLAWRALALSQELHEKYGGAPLAPGARLPQLGHPDDSLRLNALNAPNVVRACTCHTTQERCCPTHD